MRNLEILCVDDNIHVLSLVTDTLQTQGYAVETAVDGQHALQKMSLRDRPYKVIIVDVRMPHLDGCRFMMQVRASGYAGKIIVFSGHIDDNERERFRNAEVDFILEKPARPEELLRAIREVTGEVPADAPAATT